MAVGSAAPIWLLTYAAFVIAREVYHALPMEISRSLFMLFLATATANVLKYAAKPERPPAASGCIPDTQQAEKRRVAVVGAGITGLMTAKELKAEGHDVVIFEASSCLGGAWAAGGELGRGRVWCHTVSSTSAINSGISDFPLDSYVPEDEAPYHITQARFRKYVEEYANAFKLRPLIRFSHPVVSVSKTASGEKGRWIITAQPQNNEGPVVERFDFLAVCTGQVQTPNVPKFEGQDKFSGNIVHVSSVSDAEQFAEKHVVCVGNGETGSDITEVVAEKASSCFLSIRNPFVCLPRNFFGGKTVDGDFHLCIF